MKLAKNRKLVASILMGVLFLGWAARTSAMYMPTTGRFTQMDPYKGNLYDPQSLHKYLYAHGNPVNNIDPMGNFSIGEISVNMAIMAVLFSANKANAPGQGDPTEKDAGGEMVLDMGVALGTAVGAVVVTRFIIEPTRAALSPYIRGLLNELRFRNVMPVPSIQSPITNPSRLLTGSTQLEINQQIGDAFENSVRASLRTTRGMPVITSHGTVVPDLPVGNVYGVVDMKNVINLYRSPQTRGFEEVAKSINQPFSLIVSPRTQTVSKPLQDAIRNTGGTVFRFDTTSGTFRTVTFTGNRVNP